MKCFRKAFSIRWLMTVVAIVALLAASAIQSVKWCRAIAATSRAEQDLGLYQDGKIAIYDLADSLKKAFGARLSVCFTRGQRRQVVQSTIELIGHLVEEEWREGNLGRSGFGDLLAAEEILRGWEDEHKDILADSRYSRPRNFSNHVDHFFH